MSDSKKIKLYVPLIKSESEQRTVTGVVLQPEVVDAQGDIIGVEVIKEAAHDFLSKFNKSTGLGYMHEDFDVSFELCQSYIAPQDLIIEGVVVKKGSWVMVVKILDDEIWEKVKDGKIRGFSIGGTALAEKTEEAA